MNFFENSYTSDGMTSHSPMAIASCRLPSASCSFWVTVLACSLLPARGRCTHVLAFNSSKSSSWPSEGTAHVFFMDQHAHEMCAPPSTERPPCPK